MTQELIAPAYGQQHGAILHGFRDGVALGSQHVLGDQDLVAILSAADVDEVVCDRVEVLARPRCRV